MDSPKISAAQRKYSKGIKALERDAMKRLSDASRLFLNLAHVQARDMDGNQMRPEHLTLAFYQLGQGSALKTLESHGITKELLLSQLQGEVGHSPRGKITLTDRARMIIGLAGAEATWLGSETVEPDHIFLGIIRESERWEATGIEGPLYLRAAAEAAGVSLPEIEQSLRKELSRESETKTQPL